MRLTQFGLYTFPLFSKRDQVGTGDTGGGLVSLVDGASYDSTGTGAAREATTTLSTSYEIIATTATAVQTARDAIRALAGTRARLWAHFPDSTDRFVWARLARVRMERRREYVYYQPVELTFEVAIPGWHGTGHGAPWLLDDGETLDTGLYLDLDDVWIPSSSGDTETVNNGGNRMVRDVMVTITASATATISDVRIRCGSCDWTWTGTVALNKSLTIDCAARSIKYDGADAYSGLTLNAGHTIADWLQLEPGDNTVTINFSGNANATAGVTFSFYDGWM
jgi:hypothetical protein